MSLHTIVLNSRSAKHRRNCFPVSGVCLELTEKRCDQNELLTESKHSQTRVYF